MFKPNGQPLLLYLQKALPPDVCQRALRGLRKVPARENDHRNYLASEAIGYYDCRKTPFTRERLNEWVDCQPFIRKCNDVFRRELPARYKPQRVMTYRTVPEYVIGSTAFTTVTVNRWDEWHDARTRVHKDSGDLPEGFGVISVLGSGNYAGGYLVFPQYRIAVDMRTTDVLLCDVHEWHGNTAIVGQPGWERISCILYYRTAMQDCKRANGTSG